MDYHLICSEWSKVNDILFQLANLFIVLSNINFSDRYNQLFIRFCLLLSSVFFWLWGWLVLCSLDTFFWNLVFTFINVYHLSRIIYQLYPFCFALDANGLQIYEELGLKDLVSQKTFYEIVYKNVWETHCLRKGDIYCLQAVTAADRLSLLVDGRVAVIRDNTVLTELNAMSFVDSGHWLAWERSAAEVSLVALDNCRLIAWNKHLLRRTLASEPLLHAVINQKVGEHVIKTFYFN